MLQTDVKALYYKNHTKYINTLWTKDKTVSVLKEIIRTVQTVIWRLRRNVHIQSESSSEKVFDTSILQSTRLDRLPSRKRGTPEETSPPVAVGG